MEKEERPVLLRRNLTIDPSHPHISCIDITFKRRGEMDGYYLALWPITCKWKDDPPTLSSRAVELPRKNEDIRFFSFKTTVVLGSGRTDFVVSLHDADGEVVEFVDDFADVVRKKAIAIVNGRFVNDY